jgi:hypothetical protein
VALATVAEPPLVVSEPFQTWLIDWPEGIVQLTRQPVVATVPVAVTGTSTW